MEWLAWAVGAAVEAFQPTRTVVVPESERQRRQIAEAAEGQNKDVPRGDGTPGRDGH